MMATQRLVFAALVVAILISVASSAALTPGNLLMSRFTKTIDDTWGIVEIDELTFEGVLVQTISTGCILSNDYAGGLSYNQDYTTVAIACFDQNGGAPPNPDTTPIVVVALKPDGSMDKTYIPTASLPITNPMSALVDGRRVWLGTDNWKFVYAKRNGQVFNTDVIIDNTQVVTDMYMRDNVFYIGGFTTGPFFVGSVDGGLPLGNTTVTPIIMDPATPDPFAGTNPNRFYVYSADEIYGTTDNGKVFKIYLNHSSGEWLSYSANIGINTAATGVTVLEKDNTRLVYSLIGYKVVWKMEDAGTEFRNLNEAGLHTGQRLLDLESIKAPLATCSDNVMNQDETDVDCGGYSCTPCKGWSKCVLNEDCVSDYCENNVCVPQTCSDSVKNQNETDVDCGGLCSPCADNKTCLADSDCTSDVCTGGVCQSPTCNDAHMNGQETDIDCGGGTCAGCGYGQQCKVNSDCASNNCDYKFCGSVIPVSTPDSTPIGEPVEGTPTTGTSPTPVAQTPGSKLSGSARMIVSVSFFAFAMLAL